MAAPGRPAQSFGALSTGGFGPYGSRTRTSALNLAKPAPCAQLTLGAFFMQPYSSRRLATVTVMASIA